MQFQTLHDSYIFDGPKEIFADTLMINNYTAGWMIVWASIIMIDLENFSWPKIEHNSDTRLLPQYYISTAKSLL